MNKETNYTPLRCQYGARHDWSMDKVVTTYGFRMDTIMEGGIERTRIIPFKSAEELKSFYENNKLGEIQ